MCNCFYSFKTNKQIIFLKTNLKKPLHMQNLFVHQILIKKLLTILKDEYYEYTTIK